MKRVYKEIMIAIGLAIVALNPIENVNQEPEESHIPAKQEMWDCRRMCSEESKSV